MHELLKVLQMERQYRRLLSASLLSGVRDWFNNVEILSLLLHLTGLTLLFATVLMANFD